MMQTETVSKDLNFGKETIESSQSVILSDLPVFL